MPGESTQRDFAEGLQLEVELDVLELEAELFALDAVELDLRSPLLELDLLEQLEVENVSVYQPLDAPVDALVLVVEGELFAVQRRLVQDFGVGREHLDLPLLLGDSANEQVVEQARLGPDQLGGLQVVSRVAVEHVEDIPAEILGVVLEGLWSAYPRA